MTECIGEIEDTRKEMYKVAKQMVRMKDTLINQRHQVNGLGASNYVSNARIGGTVVEKRDKLFAKNGTDNALRNTIGSPLKTL